MRDTFNMKKFKNIYWFVTAFLLLLPVSVIFAKVSGGGSSGSNKLENPLQSINPISEFLNAMLGALVIIATPIVVLMLVYSGFLFVSAQGNPEKLATAKKAIMWTIIGAVVVLGASVLASAIEGTVDNIKKDPTQTQVIRI